jgi:hypothetical protein
VLLGALGATAVWLWHSGEALNYVRPGLAPLVLVAGVSIACLGGHSHGRSYVGSKPGLASRSR